MQIVYPKEHDEKIKIWQDKLEEFTRNEVLRFYLRFCGAIGPTQQEIEEFKRFILDNPFQKICIGAMCHIHTHFAPTYILPKEEVPSWITGQRHT